MFLHTESLLLVKHRIRYDNQLPFFQIIIRSHTLWQLFCRLSGCSWLVGELVD